MDGTPFKKVDDVSKGCDLVVNGDMGNVDRRFNEVLYRDNITL